MRLTGIVCSVPGAASVFFVSAPGAGREQDTEIRAPGQGAGRNRITEIGRAGSGRRPEWNREEAGSVKRDKKPVLYIVIPCYNEEKVLPLTSGIFLKKLEELEAAGKIAGGSRILFVNDGSKDATWEIICGLAKSDSRFAGIAQSRKPRASERGAGGSDVCQRALRYHDFH